MNFSHKEKETIIIGRQRPKRFKVRRVILALLMMHTCFACSSTKTYVTKSGYPQWNRIQWIIDLWFCNKCYYRYFKNPELNPETHKKHGPMRINMGGKKRIQLDKNPRVGRCSICDNNIFDGSCRRTGIHHLRYHWDEPLKDTIELCNSCHGTLTMRPKGRLWKVNSRLHLDDE